MNEDALFARQVLSLSEPVETLAPICLSPQFIEQQFAGSTQDLTTVVVEAFNVARQDKDVVIIEGGASLREGYAASLANTQSRQNARRCQCWPSFDTMAMCR